MSGRPLLVMGELSDEHRALLEKDSRASGFEPIWCATAETAAAKLSSSGFDVLLLDLMTPGAAGVCVKARSKLTRGRFPIIALAEDADEAAFTKAFRAGADEVIRLNEPSQLVRRLGPLPRPSRLPPGRARGEALIIDADRNRADVLERVLADAGYRVDIARDELAAKLNIGRPHIKLVVADAGVPSVRALFDQSRKKGARSVWVIRAKPDLIPDVSREYRPFEPVAVVSSFGPPDDVLFESNRLLDESQKNQRTEARLLFGTVAQFSSSDEPTEIGFTYNIGPAGLYVRTLALPVAEQISLEVKPPNAQLPLRLEGQVVWRREFGPTHRESAPPGFGVRLTGGSLAEWAGAFREAYATTIGTLNEDVQSSPRRPSRSDVAAVRTKSDPKLAAAPPRKMTPAPVSSTPREAMSSVDKLLQEALTAQTPDKTVEGAVPLTISGDSVEIDRSSIETSIAAEVATAGATAPTDPSTAVTVVPSPALAQPIPIIRESVPPDSSERVSVADLEPEPRRIMPRPPPRILAPPPRPRREEVTRPGNLQPLVEQTKTQPVEPVAKTAARPPEAAELPNTSAKKPRAEQVDANARTEPPGPMNAPAENAQAVTAEDVLPLQPENVPPPVNEPAASPVLDAAPVEARSAAQPSQTSPYARTMIAMDAPANVSPPPPPDLPRIPSPPAPAVAPATDATAAFAGKEESEPSHSSATDVSVQTRGARRNRTRALVVAGITAGIAAGAFLALRPTAGTPPVTAPKTAVTTATPPPAATTESPPSAATTTATQKPAEPVASVAPTAAPQDQAASAAPTTATPPAAPTATAAAPPGELSPGQAYLYVESSLDTHVFVHGVDVGATNTTVISRCGAKFVRLGSAPGQWQSDGVPLKIKCGETTRVKIP